MDEWGTIWRGNRVDWLTWAEYRWWLYHHLPFGWSILQKPHPPSESGKGEA